MDALPSAETGQKTPAPYGMLVLSLVCFTSLAASGVFVLASATALGSPDAFPENTISLVGLLGMGIWASRTWSSIAHAEPETNPVFRLKHRAFGMKAGTAIAVVLVSAAGVGAYSGIRAGHKAKLGALSKEIYDLGQRAAPTKQRFIQLAAENTQGLPEYIRRCTELEATINDYEPALRQLDNLLSQMQQEIEELKTDAGYSRLLPTVTVMRAVLAKDLEADKTYRREIGYAKQLPGIPESDRPRFYKANIQPVVGEEESIAKDQIDILKDAKARGVKLPEMYREVGIN